MKAHYLFIAVTALSLPAVSYAAQHNTTQSGNKAMQSQSQDRRELEGQAKVSEASARATALAKVPNGTVQSHELETENGNLIWTYDIKEQSGTGVSEVHVDAKTGKVLAVKHETPAEEAKEAKEANNASNPSKAETTTR